MIKFPLQQLSFVERFTLLKTLCKGKRVLHLGATGFPVTESAIAANRFLHYHLHEVAGEVVGLDFAETAIESLRSKHGITNIRHGNIERPEDYPPGPFDYVVAGEIFEHLNNPGLALSAIDRCMAGKGALIITVPNAYSLKGFCRALAGHEWIHPDHVLHHSASTLNTLLNRHGFASGKWFGYSNGGKGVAAALANSILQLRPQLAEGVGVIAVPPSR